MRIMNDDPKSFSLTGMMELKWERLQTEVVWREDRGFHFG